MPDHHLRLLHISDLHVRGPREREPWRRLRVLGDAWKRNLDDLVSDGRAIDLVCFTGDLADWGLPEEYEEASRYVDALLTRLELPKERFLIVPGNHDIQRKINKPTWRSLRSTLLGLSSLTRSRWIAGLGSQPGLTDAKRDKLLERGASFRRWLKSFGLAQLFPERSAHGRLGFRATPSLPRLSFDVHVIGLDSAWLCGDNADSGKLLLTEDQVARLATDGGQSLPGFRIALVHHPLTDLADGAACRDLLAQHVDLLLRGHLHREELATWTSPGQTLRQVAAGCLYEGDEGNTWPNACHLFDITLDDQGRPKRYDVRLRGYSDRGEGFWHDDGSLYREAPHGRLTWLARAPSIPPPSVMSTGVFVGRKAELRALEEALLPASGASRPIAICALYGMPGVGKSYLADHFAAEHAARFPGGLVRLVLRPEDDRTPAAIEAGLLGELADRCHIPEGVPDLAMRIRARLLYPRTLLHLENVDALPPARAAVALVSSLRDCPIVITGRYQDLGSSAGWPRIALAPFDEATSVEQIEAEVHLARSDAERDSFRRLASELGHLPLALHLAAAYLREGDFTVDNFLAHLWARGLDIEPDDPADPALRRDPVRANLRRTFALSLDLLRRQLGAEGDAFAAGLAALGHAPLAGFGRSLGAAISGLRPVDLDRLVQAARKLSLLMVRVEEPSQERRWYIHPLLADILRRQPGSEAARERMKAWFLERLPALQAGQSAEQGARWKEIHKETAALVAWLYAMNGEELVHAVNVGRFYAKHNGPFSDWLGIHERALASAVEPDDRSNLLWVFMFVARHAGALEAALGLTAEKETFEKARGNEREAAIAAGCRADVLEARGELDEALRIRQEEMIPVYERVGDVRERAATMGQIADILQTRGEWDEALRIRQEEELPVFEKLGVVRDRAVTIGKIADILQARGEPDEALRLRQEKVLPVFKELGDVLEYAVAWGRIGDILQMGGELDEALRIRQEEELPVYEQLGNVRERAVTMGKIADILQARGKLNEALRIRQEEELPVYEQLGDVRSLSAGRAYLALNLLARGAVGDRDAAAQLLQLAHDAAQALRIPEADTIRQIQQRHGLLPPD